MTAITATKIKDIEGWTGSAALFKLSGPVGFDGEDSGKTCEYVIVSAAIVPFSGPETYIFPADKSGEVLDWGEMPGSTRGVLSHDTAIGNAGWQIA